jgi:hypothetical protein
MTSAGGPPSAGEWGALLSAPTIRRSREPPRSRVGQAPRTRAQPRRLVATTERVRAAIRDPAERDKQPEPREGDRRPSRSDPRVAAQLRPVMADVRHGRRRRPGRTATQARVHATAQQSVGNQALPQRRAGVLSCSSVGRNQRPESWVAALTRCPDADPAGFTMVDLVTFAPPTRCCTPNPPDVITIRHVDLDAAMRPVYDAQPSSARIRYGGGGGAS